LFPTPPRWRNPGKRGTPSWPVPWLRPRRPGGYHRGRGRRPGDLRAGSRHRDHPGRRPSGRSSRDLSVAGVLPGDQPAGDRPDQASLVVRVRRRARPWNEDQGLAASLHRQGMDGDPSESIDTAHNWRRKWFSSQTTRRPAAGDDRPLPDRPAVAGRHTQAVPGKGLAERRPGGPQLGGNGIHATQLRPVSTVDTVVDTSGPTLCATTAARGDRRHYPTHGNTTAAARGHLPSGRPGQPCGERCYGMATRAIRQRSRSRLSPSKRRELCRR
jgi:hypothetical protein